MKQTKVALSALALSVLPAMSWAATPASVFDFYGNGPLLDSVSVTPLYSAGGLSATVSALKPGGAAANVAIRNDGLGVDTGGFLSNGDIEDGETLVLSFNKAVSLSNLQFSGWSDGLLGIGADHAVLSWGNQSLTLDGSTSHSWLLNNFALSDVVGTSFSIKGASGFLNTFRLAGLTATAVPEPGTMALMGLGLVGLGLASRRRVQG